MIYHLDLCFYRDSISNKKKRKWSGWRYRKRHVGCAEDISGDKEKMGRCEISFERVHRMGRWNEFNEHPRNIVAKFTYYKDREFIRTHAAQKLKGSNVWVNEQYPPEIEERRKKLYPVYASGQEREKTR